MVEIQADNSGSDISTDSWTLLEDDLSNEEYSKRLSQNEDDIIEIDSNQTETKLKPNTTQSNGFLSFDEYLQERLLEHDYRQTGKEAKLTSTYKYKLRKGLRNRNAQSWGISAFIVIILGLTAFATLCSTFLQPVIDKENVPIKTANSTQLKGIFPQVNTTTLELEELDTTKVLQPVETKPFKDKLKITNPVLGPLNQKIEETFFKCDASRNAFKATKSKPKATRTKWIVLKELILDTNLHALISLIMTNLYLFTLLADFAKRPSRKNCNSKLEINQQLLEDLEKSHNIEEIKKYLFKELPFGNAEFTRESKKASFFSKPSMKINSNGLDKKKITPDNLFRRPPLTSDVVIKPSNAEEAGKSECQRRFEELDQHQKKFEQFKQTQRNLIKQLKEKFKNEVSFIKDTETESNIRAEKINRASQMFIKKYKFTREKYLIELRKVKELRQKLAESRLKLHTRDVASGTFSVRSRPMIYDFGDKFKPIKDKFETENNKPPKGSTFTNANI